MNPASQSAARDVNRLRLRLLERTPSPLGVRLILEHEFKVMVRLSELTASEGEVLTLEFPKSAVSFVGQ